jgi:hypothetical protein
MSASYHRHETPSCVRGMADAERATLLGGLVAL